MRRYTKEIFVVVVVLALFVFASYLSHNYSDVLVESIGEYGTFGMVIYVLGAIAATVVAPLSFLPILPVAVALWGSVVAAILSIVAWTIGAIIAFLIARRYGAPLVEHMIGNERMTRFRDLMPKHHIFIAVILLRVSLPVDLVSYALGLFKVIRFWPYVFATIIGITPFAFVFAYLAEIDIKYQIGALLASLAIVALGLPHAKRLYREAFSEE